MGLSERFLLYIPLCFFFVILTILHPVLRPRPLSISLWESMLDDCCLLHNDQFGSLALSLLTGGSSFDHQDRPSHSVGYELTIDRSAFPSEDTRRFFRHYRTMLAHEFRSEISNCLRKLRNDSSLDKDNTCLEFDVMTVAPPLIRLRTKFNPG